MKGRTTLILLAAVVALGLYIQFGERHRDTVDERRDAARLALRFDPAEVHSMKIETPVGLFILERTNETWRITSPSPGLADANAVMRLIDTFSNLRRSEIITTEEQRSLGIDLAEYGLSSPRARITLGLPKGPVTMNIGRDAPGGDQLYMKRDDRGEIVVTRRDLMSALPASLLDLRDRRLFNSQPGRIKRIEIEARDRLFHAQRSEDDQWNIERPTAARGANTAIRQWLDRLYEFRITDFVADSVAAASLYGFDEPFIQVTLGIDTKTSPQTLKVGRPADVNNTASYAMIAGQDAVFTIGADAVDWLRSDTAEFRDNRVMVIPVMNIAFIQMADGDHSLQLQRNTQDVWEITSPKRLLADDRKVQQLLGAWSGAEVAMFHDPPKQPSSPHGLEGSRRSIMFARAPRAATSVLNGLASTNQPPGLSADQELTITMGLTNETGRFYAQAAGFASIMEIRGDLLATFSIDPKDYRDPVVLAVKSEEVRRITQRTGLREAVVERTNILYRTINTTEVPDTDAIDDILATLIRLTATRFVEEDPRDLSVYGLDQPLRQLTVGFASGTVINRVILFGNSANGETFATIQGGGVVFTLPDDLVSLLMKPVANPLAPAPVPIVPEAP